MTVQINVGNLINEETAARALILAQYDVLPPKQEATAKRIHKKAKLQILVRGQQNEVTDRVIADAKAKRKETIKREQNEVTVRVIADANGKETETSEREQNEVTDRLIADAKAIAADGIDIHSKVNLVCKTGASDQQDVFTPIHEKAKLQILVRGQQNEVTDRVFADAKAKREETVKREQNEITARVIFEGHDKAFQSAMSELDEEYLAQGNKFAEDSELAVQVKEQNGVLNNAGGFAETPNTQTVAALPANENVVKEERKPNTQTLAPSVTKNNRLFLNPRFQKPKFIFTGQYDQAQKNEKEDSFAAKTVDEKTDNLSEKKSNKKLVNVTPNETSDDESRRLKPIAFFDEENKTSNSSPLNGRMLVTAALVGGAALYLGRGIKNGYISIESKEKFVNSGKATLTADLAAAQDAAKSVGRAVANAASTASEVVKDAVTQYAPEVEKVANFAVKTLNGATSSAITVAKDALSTGAKALDKAKAVVAASLTEGANQVITRCLEGNPHLTGLSKS